MTPGDRALELVGALEGPAVPASRTRRSAPNGGYSRDRATTVSAVDLHRRAGGGRLPAHDPGRLRSGPIPAPAGP
ncbi:hypothetical protein, partial [Nocardia testacea]|uniref:hypothetical protein n=1 Tax=Nocardia testacea TaxID=248551 RepID=UPI000584DD61